MELLQLLGLRRRRHSALSATVNDGIGGSRRNIAWARSEPNACRLWYASTYVAVELSAHGRVGRPDAQTRSAFENAMILVMALGGSTNAVLHLIAMADSVGIELTLDDFQAVSDKTPFLADLKPSGKYVMVRCFTEASHRAKWLLISTLPATSLWRCDRRLVRRERDVQQISTMV
jgi:hypothetical protein